MHIDNPGVPLVFAGGVYMSRCDVGGGWMVSSPRNYIVTVTTEAEGSQGGSDFTQT